MAYMMLGCYEGVATYIGVIWRNGSDTLAKGLFQEVENVVIFPKNWRGSGGKTSSIIMVYI